LYSQTIPTNYLLVLLILIVFCFLAYTFYFLDSAYQIMARDRLFITKEGIFEKHPYPEDLLKGVQWKYPSPSEAVEVTHLMRRSDVYELARELRRSVFGEGKFSFGYYDQPLKETMRQRIRGMWESAEIYSRESVSMKINMVAEKQDLDHEEVERLLMRLILSYYCRNTYFNERDEDTGDFECEMQYWRGNSFQDREEFSDPNEAELEYAIRVFNIISGCPRSPMDLTINCCAMFYYDELTLRASKYRYRPIVNPDDLPGGFPAALNIPSSFMLLIREPKEPWTGLHLEYFTSAIYVYLKKLDELVPDPVLGLKTPSAIMDFISSLKPNPESEEKNLEVLWKVEIVELKDSLITLTDQVLDCFKECHEIRNSDLLKI